MTLVEFVAHQRTAFELFLIAQATVHCGGDQSPFTNAKLELVVRGPESQEGRDRSARNMQFELLTAARFCLGGVSVRDGEPDMLIAYGAESIGVAAKRVTSMADTQVRTRVREAVEQIERTQYRGIVAINLESHIKPVPTGGAIPQVLESADAAFEIVGELASEFVANKRLLGMIAVDSLIRQSSVPSPNQYPSLDTTTPIRYWLYGNVLERITAMSFFATWRDRWLASLSRSSTDFEADNV